MKSIALMCEGFRPFWYKYMFGTQNAKKGRKWPNKVKRKLHIAVE